MPEPASGKRRGTPLAPPLQNMTSSPRGTRAHGEATKRGDLGPAAGDLDSTMLDRDPARCSLSSLMAGLGCCCDEETTTTTTPATALQPKAQPAPALLSPSLNQEKKAKDNSGLRFWTTTKSAWLYSCVDHQLSGANAASVLRTGLRADKLTKRIFSDCDFLLLRSDSSVVRASPR